MQVDQRLNAWERPALDRWLFIAFLAINLAIPFTTHFYPTLDGPAHLHNAQLLRSYLVGDPTVRAHFALHPDPVPNWTDHAALAMLLCILPAWLAEKFLVCAYIALIAVGFRKLVHTIAPRNIGLSLLVFPLIHNELFDFGFYNFSVGVALMLWVLALEWHANSERDLTRLVRLLLMATVLYFSNVLAFALALFILMGRALFEARSNGSFRATFLRRATVVAVCFLPGSICFLWFQARVHYFGTDPGKPMSELLAWLWDARPLIVFGYEAERPFTRLYTWILLALVALLFISRARPSKGSHVLLIAMALVLMGFFMIPDSYSAGMMNDRFALFFFLLLAVWLAVNVPHGWAASSLVASAAVLQLAMAFMHWPVRRDLDLYAQQVERAATTFPAGSIVYPVLLSDNWLHKHLSNYLGVDKPMIILENYEARLGWFPLRWREGRPSQKCIAGPVPYGVRCDATAEALPDHVALIGDTTWLSRKDLIGLREGLRTGYTALPATGPIIRVFSAK